MRLIDVDELYVRLMARYTAHNLDDTRDMAARAGIMSCMEAVERSKTITISQPPNDPLTLEELREMDGEQVWIDQPDGSKDCSGWARVELAAPWKPGRLKPQANYTVMGRMEMEMLNNG